MNLFVKDKKKKSVINIYTKKTHNGSDFFQYIKIHATKKNFTLKL